MKGSDVILILINQSAFSSKISIYWITTSLISQELFPYIFEKKHLCIARGKKKVASIEAFHALILIMNVKDT